MGTSARQKAQQILDEVATLAPSEQEAAIARLSGDDASLAAEVRALLGTTRPTVSIGSTTADSDAMNAPADWPLPRNDEQPGSTIGPYKLIRQLGEGGFGSVFMAEQDRPVKRTVALKVIKLGMDTRQVVARFEQERQALAILDHPNIAKVFDAGATQTGRPYFVMELCTGEPIDQYCDRHRLSIEPRLELFAQVCLAVQHAHTKGLIHRDIKPSNVLVATQDDKPLAKVIDFGIAKATASKLTEQTLFTEQRGPIGTPQYMSPEQAEGSLDIDTRTDVYGLGVLLYQLLTGTTPFTGKELRSAAYAEIQRIIREVEPPRPSTRLSQNTEAIASVAACRQIEPRKLSTTVRGELDWIVMKCLEKDRTRRYETANGLAMDVRRYLAGEAVQAAPPSTTYRFKKFVQRNRGAVSAGTAIAALLLIGITAFAWQARLAMKQRDRAVVAEAEASRRANEVQQVADFQARILQQVDVTQAGLKLMEDLRARHDAALEKSHVPEDEKSARTAAFESELQEVNATDAAAAMLDRAVMAPAVHTIDAQFASQPLVDATLRTTLADAYDTLGQFNQALLLYQRAYELRAKSLGDENRDTLLSRGGVGKMQGELQRLPEAEANTRAALDGLTRLLGDDAVDTLDAKSQLASQMLLQGRYEQSEDITRDLLARRQRVLGPEHPEALKAKNNLGHILLLRGHYDDAAEVLSEVVEAERRVDESLLPVTLNNLGAALIRQNKRAAAEPYLREATERHRKRFGEDHPETVAAIATLATLLMDLNQLPEAEALAREAMEKSRRSKGSEHADTLKDINIMGQVLFREGKYAEAEAYYREALATGRRVLGEDHPDTIIWISNMGMVLRQQGRVDEAEPYYREAMQRNRRVMGQTHPYTIALVKGAAELVRQQNKPAEAEAMYRSTLEALRRVEGEDHPETANMLGQLGSVLRDQGKLDEAEACFEQVLEKSRRLSGEDHPDTLTAILRVGTVRLARGKYAETIALLTPIEGKVQQVIPGMTGVLRHASLLGMLGKARAGLARQPGEFAQAEANLIAAQATFAKMRGEKDKETREWAQALAECYAAWDKADPGKGHGLKATEWNARLDSLRAATMPAVR